jgi:hypothetical protein
MRILALVVIAICSFSTCISHVETDSTPCPCGNGFECCPTLGLCLSPDETCPKSIPLSTANKCEQDFDCPAGELCASWRLSNGEPGGPRTCRKACPGGLICAPDETCAWSYHDDTQLSEQNLKMLCLADEESCQPWRCLGCANLAPGETQCLNQQLTACLLGLHRQCGLYCQEIVVRETCSGIFPYDPCEEASCSSCHNEYGTTPHCQDNHSINACLYASPPEDGASYDCSEYCIHTQVAECPNGCSQTSDQDSVCLK